MSIELWTLVIAVVTSLVCALCGTLLLVNRESMVSEGLSHAVLPGLVLAFILFRDYSSPWLIPSAAASGMVMVWLSNWLKRTRLVEPDAGLGLVFAGMFSVGVLMVNQNLKNVHFHEDCIIEGNLAAAPIDTIELAGFETPRAFVLMSFLLLIVGGFITLFFKELKLTLFDPSLAARFRMKPAVLQFVSLSLISLTTVAAFELAGSILIVGLMIAPPAAAYLLTNKLQRLLLIACGLGAVSAVAGALLASRILNTEPTGPIASCAGCVFLFVLAFAPRRGLIAGWLQVKRDSAETRAALVLDLIDSQSSPASECQLAEIVSWTRADLNRMLGQLQDEELIEPRETGYALTSRGRVRLDEKLMSF